MTPELVANTEPKSNHSDAGQPSLTYQGKPIHLRDEMMNLTSMWKAAGSPDGRAPADWRALASTQVFVEFLAENVIAGFPGNEAFQVDRGGRSPGTWAHWQLGFSYAKYLSPEFHAWCNEVARERMEGKPRGGFVPQIDVRNPSQLTAIAMQLIEVNNEQRLAIETMVPKVDAFDRIAGADGSLNMTEAAKALQVLRKVLRDFLEQNKWIYRRAGSKNWLGYQARVASGDLTHKVHTTLEADGTERINEQMRITPKGLAKLAKLMPSRLSEVK